MFFFLASLAATLKAANRLVDSLVVSARIKIQSSKGAEGLRHHRVCASRDAFGLSLSQGRPYQAPSRTYVPWLGDEDGKRASQCLAVSRQP